MGFRAGKPRRDVTFFSADREFNQQPPMNLMQSFIRLCIFRQNTDGPGEPSEGGGRAKNDWQQAFDRTNNCLGVVGRLLG